MTGIGIPPIDIDGATAVDGSVWPGIVAAVVLAVVFAAAIWTYVRTRPRTAATREDEEIQLREAA
jgi:hypothetical protein